MSSRDDIMKNRGGRQYNRPPRQDDPPGGEDGYTFTEKQIEAMSGDFYNPETPVTPVAPVGGGGLNGRTGQSGQSGQNGQAGQTAAAASGAQAPVPVTSMVGADKPILPDTAVDWAHAQAKDPGLIDAVDRNGDKMTGAPRVSDGEIIDRFLSDRYGLQPMSKEEREKQERGRKANKLIAAVADGLTAIAKMHYISKGAPYVATTSTLSGTMQKRYDELDAQRKSMDKQYLDAYLQMQRQLREERRQKELDEYRREQLEIARRRQDEADAYNRWRMANGDAKLEQQKEHQQNQDETAKQKATAATMNAQANQTRANKTGTGGGGRGRSGGKSQYDPRKDQSMEEVTTETITTNSNGSKTKEKVHGYRKKGSSQGSSGKRASKNGGRQGGGAYSGFSIH